MAAISGKNAVLADCCWNGHRISRIPTAARLYQAMAVVIQRVRRDQMVNRGSSCSGLSHTMSILGLVASCCETNTRNAMMHPTVPSTANQRANTHRSKRQRHSIQAHSAPIITRTAMLTPIGAA